MSDAELSLRSLLDTVARDQQYDNHAVTLKHISTGGGNYTSELYLITITAENKKDLQLFAKIANIKGKLREEIPITTFYSNERFVYGTVVNIYHELEERNNVPKEHRLNFPKYYGCNPNFEEETIVLEDLSVKGFITHDRFKSIDWEYACTAVKELAKFHALSFAYAADKPEEFAEVMEKMKFAVMGDEEKVKALWGRMVAGAVGVTKEENRERLKNYFEATAMLVRDFYKPVRRPVLAHGDFRPSNLMHRVKDDGSLEMIAVDYQTVRAGCVAIDLLYLIFTGTDEQFRAAHYEALVEEYFSQLTAAIRRLGLDAESVYPREDFDYEMKQCLPFGLTVAVFILPIVTVEAANAPKIGELDMATWEIKTGQLYPERVNGIVNDYIKWGVI